jgi:hypothetical protein
VFLAAPADQAILTLGRQCAAPAGWCDAWQVVQAVKAQAMARLGLDAAQVACLVKK